MDNLSVYELNLIKDSLEVHLKNYEAFKRGNYGKFTKVEEEKIDRKIDDIKEILIKLKDITM